jgi:lipopolysaccharide transport system permease protein
VSAPERDRWIVPDAGWWPDPREVWERRDLLYFLVLRELQVRYKQTVLGVAWAVLQPVLVAVAFTVFLGLLARVPTGGLPAPVFYLAGLVPWAYFAAAVTASTQSLAAQQHLITKVYFPRVLLPLAAPLAGLVDLALAGLVLLAALAAWGFTPGPAALLVLPLVALLVATAVGVSLWLSALNARYRDVRHAVGFLLQLWLFASPVAYPATLVPERWRWAYSLNPLAGVVEGFRWALTGAGHPPGVELGVSAAVVAVVLATGFAYFQRVEGTLADVV